jgi:hypothetical protein
LPKDPDGNPAPATAAPKVATTAAPSYTRVCIRTIALRTASATATSASATAPSTPATAPRRLSVT